MEHRLPDPWTLLGILIGLWSIWEARKGPPGKHRKSSRRKYRRGKRKR